MCFDVFSILPQISPALRMLVAPFSTIDYVAPTITRYGSPAVVALQDAIHRCRTESPLSPVAIVVPSLATGMSVLQELAIAEGGVFGIRHMTVAGLADHICNLSEPLPRNRRTSRSVAAALRQLPASEFGVFQAVREHPSTERVLVQTLRELEHLSEADLQTLQNLPNEQAQDLVVLERSVRERLGGKWVSNAEILKSACDLVPGTREALKRELGEIVVFLPQLLSETAAELLRKCEPAETIVGQAGIPEADRVPFMSAGRLLEDDLPPPASEAALTAAPEVTVVSAATPEDEVRLAIRGVIDALRNGVAPHMIAIAAVDSYMRLLIDHLEEAELGYTTASDFPLKERIQPRAVLGLLELQETGMRRPDLMEILSSAPIANPATGSDVPDAAWNRVSKEAKVSGREWEERLKRYVHIQEKSAARKTDNEELDKRRAKWAESNISYAESLLKFVKYLDLDLKKISAAESWKGKLSEVRALIRKYFPAFTPSDSGLPEETSGAELPEAETKATERLQSILTQLEALDEIEPSPSQASFLRALSQELAEPSGRRGKGGVRVLNLDSLLAGSVDHLFVLGMAEGVFPEKLKEDSLLPESCREAIADLTLRGERVHTQHRYFLAALQLPKKSLTISYPRRGDHGDSIASRWLLDLVQELEGSKVTAEDLGDYLKSAGEKPEKSLRGVFVASLSSALQSANLGIAGFPSHCQEFNLQSLLGTSPSAILKSELAARNQQFASGIEMQLLRESQEFSRFDGNLGAFDGFEFSEPLSAFRFEKWFECPHAFLMSCVLGVHPAEDFRETDRLSPLVRGQIIHDALEAFFKKHIGVSPDAAWQESHKRELSEIASHLCEEAISDFSFGLPLYHSQEKQSILSDLSNFLDEDSEYRREAEAVPAFLEGEFGYAGQPQASFSLPDGREIALRGRIDRVDLCPDALVVIDYKTGKHNSGETNQQYAKLSEANPHGEGRRLQLPLYLEGALALLGERSFKSAKDMSARAMYWFVTASSDFYRREFALSQTSFSLIEDALAVVCDGITEGVFPVAPHKSGMFGVTCGWCNPDGFGPSKYGRTADSKHADPALWKWLEIAYPKHFQTASENLADARSSSGNTD